MADVLTKQDPEPGEGGMDQPPTGLLPRNLSERNGAMSQASDATMAEQVRATLAADALYSPYIERDARVIKRLLRDENEQLPEWLDYKLIPGLTTEARERLVVVRPRALGQAGRIEGITPAALTLLLMHIRRPAKELISR